ncbi:MAG: TraR/DksA C4-type zinc finger protein [Candidatus Accumulibacter phosphatis]|uniref:TraR/DksA family transcriptional regulator n=1 Tax=Candidatus Accumulibacter contiguus TaxID=2954381 RepID=A0ABX1T6J2_9PROT|nr:TraR/DksA C4-type zinc finger protein [Candidatus Accumulibacter contiguus]NMQ05259.1 TraR/DksA family transcriptional regulator [Candidatus Accumulibacter contiguus]
MSDVYDRATERAAEMLFDSLFEQQRRAGLTGRTVEDSALVCVNCGDPIPELRRSAYPGVTRCIDCQQFQESKRHAR